MMSLIKIRIPGPLRMIRAQVALDKARHVVTEYCSDDGKRRSNLKHIPVTCTRI
jgi:hypothetical protein